MFNNVSELAVGLDWMAAELLLTKYVYFHIVHGTPWGIVYIYIYTGDPCTMYIDVSCSLYNDHCKYML